MKRAGKTPTREKQGEKAISTEEREAALQLAREVALKRRLGMITKEVPAVAKTVYVSYARGVAEDESFVSRLVGHLQELREAGRGGSVL